jgi:uncharacterized protein YaeQ
VPPAGQVLGFELAVSDVDRGVYDTLTVQVAQHPSESTEYLVTRVLAYALEHREGIAFSHGLHVADEPALWVRDLTGQLLAWIEVGTPELPRLHRATKACDEVVVWCHKDAPRWLAMAAADKVKVHRPERVRVVEVGKPLVAWLAERLDRRNKWAISRTEGEVYVEVTRNGVGETFTATLPIHPWPA